MLRDGVPSVVKEQIPLTIALTILIASAPAIGQTDLVQPERERPSLKIAVVLDGPSPALSYLEKRIREETLELIGDEFSVSFEENKRIEGDWSLAGAEAAVKRVLADSEVGMILGMGLLTTQALAEDGSYPKPVILPVTLDPEFHGLPHDGGRSGIRNLAYVVAPGTFSRDITLMHEVLGLTTIDVVLPSHLIDALPHRPPESISIEGSETVSIRLTSADETAAGTLAAIPEDSQGVYLGPLANMSREQVDLLLAGLRERRIPSFWALGPGGVRRGALLSGTPEGYWDTRARRVALFIQRILLGENTGSFSTVLTPDERLTFNVATARAIGVSPPWRVMDEADIVGAEPGSEEGEPLSLINVLRAAIEGNRELQASEYGYQAAGAEVDVARGRLLPSADASLSGSLIDQDRAGSVGSPGIFSMNWSASASTPLFSEAAWTGLRVQEHLEAATEQERNTVELDIILQAAEAYMGMLRAQTALHIQRENLRRGRGYLATAEVRQTVGSATAAEVYRWQSSIAQNRISLAQAVESLNTARRELNRVLGRPIEMQLLVEEVTIDDIPQFAAYDERVMEYIETPRGIEVLARFMAEEAIGQAPELRQLDATIDAQRRSLEGEQRAMWAPTISLQGGVTHNFLHVGGNNPTDTIEGVSEGVDPWDMQLGLVVSLPLIEGGSRFARIRQTRLEIGESETRREELEARVVQLVANSIQALGTTGQAVHLSRVQIEASRNALRLVENAYTAGAGGILELLDAQNQALLAELTEADAVYEFIINIFRLQRSIGIFWPLQEENERQAFVQRQAAFLHEYSPRSGVSPDRVSEERSNEEQEVQ